MTSQPARVTPGEISALLEQARQLAPGSSLDERIAYHARKADLLSRIAADLGTIEAADVALMPGDMQPACAAMPALRTEQRQADEDVDVLG